MAKQILKDDRGRVKFRVIEFELDGSDSALQDAIKGLTTAISDRQKTAYKLTTGNGKAALPVSDEGVDTIETQDIAQQVEEISEVQAARPRNAGNGKPRAVARPKVIDLDLKSGDQSLKQYLETLNPETDSRRYLEIAYWFKHKRQIESIGMNHIYTAYREMGWNNVPADPLLPFRNGKNQGWFDSGAKRGEYTLNHIGEGRVGKK